MKKINMVIAFSIFVCAIILGSCGKSGSSGTPASDPVVSDNSTRITVEGGGSILDNDTELQTGFQGLGVEKVFIVDGNDKRISNSGLALNTKFSIVYEGVKNYTLKNGKVFPGLSINVSDNNGTTVIQEADLLAHYTDGLSEEDASVLRATITVGDPMKAGKYICSVQVVDKNNINSTILSTWGFEVK